MPKRPCRLAPGGLVLAVRVTPKGGRDAIDGVIELPDGNAALKVRLRAAPREGEANAALIRLMARTLDVPSGAVAVTAGAGGRIKRLKITGAGPTLVARLDAICAALPVS